ncbi:MAG TPA: hypothetical protein VFY14_07235 [Streptomyces sp.]|nr:hypothetical protein [Streptomyces sp.]
MTTHDAGYVAGLAGQLATRRPDLLELAEDELRQFRSFKAIIAAFIHNPSIAHDIRAGLARDLGLPEPRHPKTTQENSHG